MARRRSGDARAGEAGIAIFATHGLVRPAERTWSSARRWRVAAYWNGQAFAGRDGPSRVGAAFAICAKFREDRA